MNVELIPIRNYITNCNMRAQPHYTLLDTLWTAKDIKFLLVDNAETDLTVLMCMVIQVSAGCTSPWHTFLSTYIAITSFYEYYMQVFLGKNQYYAMWIKWLVQGHNIWCSLGWNPLSILNPVLYHCTTVLNFFHDVAYMFYSFMH